MVTRPTTTSAAAVRREPAAARRCRGAAYMVLLFAVAAVGMAAAGVLQLGVAHERFRVEDELLFVGSEYRQALRRWREAAPGDGAESQGPRRLEDLLLDPRSASPRRHLRRLYADPLTGRADWVLLRDERGAILGLHSASTRAPLRQDNFPPDYFFFKGRSRYSDWLFVWGVVCTERGCELPGARPIGVSSRNPP